MKERDIIALEMPGNIQKPFYEFQTELFRQLCMPTARLFPPIIPLSTRRLTSETENCIRQAIGRTEQFAAKLKINQHRGVFYSPVEVLPFWDYPIDQSSFLSEFPDMVLPKTPVILLALSENNRHKAEVSELHSPVQKSSFESEVISWKKMYIVEITIRMADTNPWWREVYWTYSRSVKVSCDVK